MVLMLEGMSGTTRRDRRRCAGLVACLKKQKNHMLHCVIDFEFVFCLFSLLSLSGVRDPMT